MILHDCDFHAIIYPVINHITSHTNKTSFGYYPDGVFYLYKKRRENGLLGMKKWIKMQEAYICPNCGVVSTTQPKRCPSCAGILTTYDDKSDMEETNWILKTASSDGDEDPDRYFRTWAEAVQEMKAAAMDELLAVSENTTAVLTIPRALGIVENERSCMEIHFCNEDGYVTVVRYMVERF